MSQFFRMLGNVTDLSAANTEQIAEALLDTAANSGSAADAFSLLDHHRRTAVSRLDTGLGDRKCPSSSGPAADALYATLLQTALMSEDNVARVTLSARVMAKGIGFAAATLAAMPVATAVSQSVHAAESLRVDASNAALVVTAALSRVAPDLTLQPPLESSIIEARASTMVTTALAGAHGDSPGNARIRLAAAEAESAFRASQQSVIRRLNLLSSRLFSAVVAHCDSVHHGDVAVGTEYSALMLIDISKAEEDTSLPLPDVFDHARRSQAVEMAKPFRATPTHKVTPPKRPRSDFSNNSYEGQQRKKKRGASASGRGGGGGGGRGGGGGGKGGGGG
jgi:uncharacterized membrane protein YgcG